MLHLPDEAPVVQVGIVVQVLGVQHGAGRHAAFGQQAHGLVLVPRRSPSPDEGLQGFAVPVAAGVVLKARVRQQAGLPDDGAERLPHALRHRHHIDIVVGAAALAGIQAQGGQGAGAGAQRRPGAEVAVGGGGAHVEGHRLLHGHFDHLPLAGLQFLHIGGGDGQGHLHAGAGIPDGGAWAHGRAVRLAGDGEGAGGRLGHHVVALVVRPGAVQAEALDAGVDDVRLRRLEDLVAEVQLFDDAGAVVFDEDVVMGDHLQQNVPPLRAAQVQA